MGNFKRANKTLVGKGTKAMYDILKSGEFHNLSISCQLELFDKVVKPILILYTLCTGRLIGDLMGTIGQLFPLTDKTDGAAVNQVQ
jgi:hypothetical protein